MPKLVYLDAHTLNPGDLDWSVLEVFGTLKTYPRTSAQEVIARSQEADVILTNKVYFNDERLQQLPKLKLLVITATGYNIIDVAACRKLGITVCNIPNYGTEAVAQHTWALLLALSNQVATHTNSVKQGDWARNLDWCYWTAPITSLIGKTLGIFGMGKIGQEVGRIAKAFKMEVIYHSRKNKNLDFAQWVEKDTLWQQADIISLHAPLTPETKHIINKESLAQMKKGAFILNTGRGDLIAEPDLVEALRSEKIAGAALDVMSQEPPPLSHPFYEMPQVYLTPHNAWCSQVTRQTLLDIAAENVKAFLEDKPVK